VTAIQQCPTPDKSRADAPADLFPETLKSHPLFGRIVSLDTPCRQCATKAATIQDGKGPHAALLVCAGCGRYRQWVSHESFSAIQKFVAEIADKFGCPETITLRAIKRENLKKTTILSGRQTTKKNATTEARPFSDELPSW